MPFWSPDSRRIGVPTNDEKLKTIALDGSGAIPVCSAPRGPGGASGLSVERKGFILFQSASGHLLKVPEKGGEPVPATKLERGHVGHAWPSFLPDGEHFLFFASGVGEGELRVGSLSTTESTSLGPITSAPLYASGHLLFLDGGLMVSASDVASLEGWRTASANHRSGAGPLLPSSVCPMAASSSTGSRPHSLHS